MAYIGIAQARRRCGARIRYSICNLSLSQLVLAWYARILSSCCPISRSVSAPALTYRPNEMRIIMISHTDNSKMLSQNNNNHVSSCSNDNFDP